MATFTVTTNAIVNQPPSQVGDGAASTDYGITYTFTTADFTSLTTPIYVDPEGDTASLLKVITLPATGELQLNAVAVTINQIISFTDIGNSLFTFVPDNLTEISYVENFNFEIADSGSGQFVG